MSYRPLRAATGAGCGMPSSLAHDRVRPGDWTGIISSRAQPKMAKRSKNLRYPGKSGAIKSRDLASHFCWDEKRKSL